MTKKTASRDKQIEDGTTEAQDTAWNSTTQEERLRKCALKRPSAPYQGEQPAERRRTNTVGKTINHFGNLRVCMKL